MLCALAAVSMASGSLTLLEHLVAQGAPRAAARLATVPLPAALHDLEEETQFTVPESSIMLVDDDVSARRFVAAMGALPSGSTIALDAEWRPDARGSQRKHRPSLVQLATADAVWLLDVESPAVLASATSAGVLRC